MKCCQSWTWQKIIRNHVSHNQFEQTVQRLFGLTTPNAAPIEYDFTPFQQYPPIVSHIMTKPDLSFFKKQVRYMFGICLCMNVRTA